MHGKKLIRIIDLQCCHIYDTPATLPGSRQVLIVVIDTTTNNSLLISRLSVSYSLGELMHSSTFEIMSSVASERDYTAFDTLIKQFSVKTVNTI